MSCSSDIPLSLNSSRSGLSTSSRDGREANALKRLGCVGGEVHSGCDSLFSKFRLGLGGNGETENHVTGLYHAGQPWPNGFASSESQPSTSVIAAEEERHFRAEKPVGSMKYRSI